MCNSIVKCLPQTFGYIYCEIIFNFLLVVFHLCFTITELKKYSLFLLLTDYLNTNFCSREQTTKRNICINRNKLPQNEYLVFQNTFSVPVLIQVPEVQSRQSQS